MFTSFSSGRGRYIASSVGPAVQVVPGMARATNVLYDPEDQLVSHAQRGAGINLIKDMEDAISPKLNYAKFAEVAKEYTNLLRAHIQKENNVLFPMAERALTPSQLAGLYNSFEEHEEAPWGARTALVIPLGRVNGQLQKAIYSVSLRP
jgi:hypothetical protein